MLNLVSPVQTRAHRWPVAGKLLALACATLVLFRLDHLAAQALAALAVAALVLAPGPVFARAVLRALRPLWPFLAILVLWHLAFGDLSGGASLILRLLTTVTLATLVSMTTPLAAMTETLGRLLAPLRHLGLPPKALALAIALTIRFVPVTLQRIEALQTAFRARSPRRPGWRILMPAALATLDDADHVAQALRARGGAG